MSYHSMFDQNLVRLDTEAKDKTELFQQVAQQLERHGFVNEDYLIGITERENNFPTGLITQHLNIALPHSDPQYIKQPFVYVVRLKEAITVNQMGDNQAMKVKDFFFLGIKEPSKQVGLLQTFMTLFMDQEFVKRYEESKSETAVHQLFMENI